MADSCQVSATGCDDRIMGEIGRIVCTATCGFEVADLYAGAGMEATVELRRCPRCGDVFSQFNPLPWVTETEPAQSERCGRCDNDDLEPADDVEALINATEYPDEHPGPAPPVIKRPRCPAPLAWESEGMWD